MSERSKYPINGICRFENFRELYRNNVFPRVPVGRICYIDGWFVSLREKEINDISYIYPYLHCPPLPGCKQVSIRCFFSFLNQKPSDNFRKVSRVLVHSNWRPIGNSIEFDELIDEENGWLSDGTLCIEYGFCVESMEGTNKIWKFNFHDKLFDCDEKHNMITLEDNGWSYERCPFLYIHKQLLEFHSPYFKEETQTVDKFKVLFSHQYALEVLQILHGVNIRVREPCYTLNNNSICKFNAMNVRRYCERQLIEREVWLEPIAYYFFIASLHNLNHLLVCLLKYVKSGKCLAKIISRDMKIEEMSSEFMKQCTRFYFENSKTDFGKYN